MWKHVPEKIVFQYHIENMYNFDYLNKNDRKNDSTWDKSTRYMTLNDYILSIKLYQGQAQVSIEARPCEVAQKLNNEKLTSLNSWW